MLSEVSRRTAKKQPVAFLGWSPHWMTLEFNLTFLEDPERSGRVQARSGCSPGPASVTTTPI